MEQNKKPSPRRQGAAGARASNPASRDAADSHSSEGEGAAGKQVIARAAAVLRALEGQVGGLSLAQIAQGANLPRSTVHRIVAALEAQQMVMSGAGGVRLGPALARLAASAHTDLVAVARPHVEALSQRTRETVDLCQFRGQHAISVDQAVSNQELRVVSPVGTAFPAHCTAHGKALLARRSDDEVAALFAAGMPKRTGATLASLDALLKELARVRKLGYAVDAQEHAEGMCGIGVWLRTGLPDDYALAIAVPALRFERQREGLLSALMQCKSEIETLMHTAAAR
ncbi:IclR family transcriptional regulator [Burkholderia sp. Ac-20379]|uniref:IclR family transcriptional regulator n=1 Tax=Burkholderia sp. Ac-20379 TaxID=2703900 RepID=UPI0019819532|nr:IclR family transcriptional regulator [Burkholderia sp. Ac-20379]MBN3728191.1 IclR family transcriptional regulator [Burkholderia sp. Ac-20379]